MGRIYSIDFLRGLMAVLVMIYHYNSWAYEGLDSSSILSRFGLYAVSIFYIISGYALAHVYSGKGKGINSINYFSARFFRIAPLFYVVSIAFLLKGIFFGNDVSLFNIFLNFSFLFAIIDPSAYFATGAWSIGNEMFFYLILFAAVKSNRYRSIFQILFFISVILFFFYRMVLLDPASTLPSQWVTYINPLNHILFFVMGMAFFSLRLVVHRYSKALLPLSITLSTLIFVYPVYGDRVALVTGWISFVMFLSSISIFLSFLILDKFNLFSTYFFRFLGDISYAVYLLHPLIWFVSSRLLSGLSMYYVITFSVLITIIVSWVSFQYFEKPVISFGKRCVKRVKFD